jgi:oligosaccharide repeat unit polymerase
MKRAVADSRYRAAYESFALLPPLAKPRPSGNRFAHATLVLCAIVLLMMGRSPTPAILSIVVESFTYILLAWIGVFCYRAEGRDGLVPLLVVFLLFIARFLIPGIVVAAGGARAIGLFSQMGLGPSEWYTGHVIALLGLSGYFLGWLLVPSSSGASRPLIRGGRMISYWPGILLIGVGLLSLAVFVMANASLAEVATTGEFRSLEVRTGTGFLFYLSLFAISGSALLASAISARRGRALRLFFPAVVVATAYLLLGGRARAATPLIAAFVVFWYTPRLRMGNRRPHRIRFAVAVALIGGCALWFLILGELYRGGEGLRAISETSRPHVWMDYLTESAVVDVGQLHALAAAARVPPGSLSGQTFVGALTWPLSELLHLPSESAGLFIVRETLGDPHPTWGVLAALPGDAYVNFGLLAVPIICLVAGLAVHLLYRGFRLGKVNLPLFALATTYSFRIMFESIEKWPEALVVCGAAALADWGADALSMSSHQDETSPSSTRR